MFDQPIFFKPIMMERVGGGNNLEALFGKKIPPGKIIGESWELSDRPEAQSVVDGGPFDGWTLRQLIEKYPREILGDLPDTGRFPLLLKYVDAGDKLSVQVHPDDAGAKKYNDLGKSECWVIVRAEPGAKIVRGLKAGTTREAYMQAVSENHVEEVLHSFEPKVGDVVALPAGMVHAIGAGLVVAEIQQNSDLTFRIYDYGRMGLDGKPRKLHVEEALEAIRFDKLGDEFREDMRAQTVTPVRTDPMTEHLLTGKYFDLARLTITSNLNYITLNRALVAMVVAGEGAFGARIVRAGTTALFSAGMERVQISVRKKLVMLVGRPK